MLTGMQDPTRRNSELTRTETLWKMRADPLPDSASQQKEYGSISQTTTKAASALYGPFHHTHPARMRQSNSWREHWNRVPRKCASSATSRAHPVRSNNM